MRISASTKALKIKTLNNLSSIKQNKLAKILCDEVTLQGNAAKKVSYRFSTQKQAFYCNMLSVEFIQCELIIY